MKIFAIFGQANFRISRRPPLHMIYSAQLRAVMQPVCKRGPVNPAAENCNRDLGKFSAERCTETILVRALTSLRTFNIMRCSRATGLLSRSARDEAWRMVMSKVYWTNMERLPCADYYFYRYIQISVETTLFRYIYSHVQLDTRSHRVGENKKSQVKFALSSRDARCLHIARFYNGKADIAYTRARDRSCNRADGHLVARIYAAAEIHLGRGRCPFFFSRGDRGVG